MERQSKVLVVDDDQFALRSVAKVLEGESYQVVAVASGSEALDLLKQDSFDLILTDLKMPEVDGFEVLRQAREIAPQAVVLVLMKEQVAELQPRLAALLGGLGTGFQRQVREAILSEQDVPWGIHGGSILAGDKSGARRETRTRRENDALAV